MGLICPFDFLILCYLPDLRQLLAIDLRSLEKKAIHLDEHGPKPPEKTYLFYFDRIGEVCLAEKHGTVVVLTYLQVRIE